MSTRVNHTSRTMMRNARDLWNSSMHTQIINEILKPRWGDKVAVAIKPKQIKDWLYTIEAVEDTTRHKYKDVMGVVYKFAQSEGLIPLGEQFNPVSYVTGIPSVSDYEANCVDAGTSVEGLGSTSTAGIHDGRVGRSHGNPGERNAGTALVRHPVGAVRNQDQTDLRPREYSARRKDQAVEIYCHDAPGPSATA